MLAVVVLATVAEYATTCPADAELAGLAAAVAAAAVVEVLYRAVSDPEPDDGPKAEPLAGAYVAVTVSLPAGALVA